MHICCDAKYFCIIKRYISIIYKNDRLKKQSTRNIYNKKYIFIYLEIDEILFGMTLECVYVCVNNILPGIIRSAIATSAKK